MRAERLLVGLVAPLVVVGSACASEAPERVIERSDRFDEVVDLPPPDVDGEMSLEAVLSQRRSGRAYTDDPLPLPTIGQLLWAAQGVTDDAGHRTAPSAGAHYPLELYAVTASEVYHYLPEGHRAERRTDATTLDELGTAAFDQQYVSTAPLVVVVVGVPGRTASEYGALAPDFVQREAGHATQNLLLQATALGLAAVPVGGVDPERVDRLLALPPGQEVLYVVPVGEPVE